MYRVQLQNFEGPLDLLLFFIKRDELDVYNIPIAYITDQFLEYIHFLDELDLQVASEFIYMASMLMSIKAKMMIPSEKSEDELEPEEDPRYELVQALLEYKRYKEVGEELSVLDQKAQLKYSRGFHETDTVEPEVDSGEALRDISLFDLMAAFKQVMLIHKKEPVKHKIEKFETTIEQQMHFVVESLKRKGRSSFIQLCEDVRSRIALVVTFLAILEMVKEHKLNLYIGDTPLDFHLELSSADPTLDFEIDSYN
ncbi:hypothetical protein EP331_05845 [bacterium]|nr:MAG: hypothetical protein EP331_05845 [bacterium]